MDREEILHGLQEAGLSEYEADAYLTLLEHGTLQAVEVARRCSVPTPRIYDTLTGLEQREYVETLDRDTLYARAKNPVEVLEDIRDRSARLSDLASEIEDRWERSPFAEHEVTVTRQGETAVERAKELIRNAENSVDLAVNAGNVADVASALAAVDRGPVVRVSIHGTETGDVEDLLETYPGLETVTEIRARSLPGPFLAVVDQRNACFSPIERLPEPYGIVVDDELITFVFRWYFETCLWGIWETVHRREVDGIVYTNLEQLVYDLYEVWHAGAVVTVTVEGVDPRSGEWREVSGLLGDIYYTNQSLSDRRPRYLALSGQVTAVVWTPDDPCTVGSWGAWLEDVEAQRITVENVELDVPWRVSGPRDWLR